MRKQIRIIRVAMLCAGALLVACGPSEKQKVELAEQRRTECLDKICEGDVAPKQNPGETILKLNGGWYRGPREHFNMNGAVFYWSSRTPGFRGGSFAEKGQPFYDVAIEIFLQRHDGVLHGPNRYARLKQAKAEGRLVSKTMLRPGLEMWRTQENDGLGPGLWYVATKYVEADPNGSVLSCRDVDPAYARCVTAFMWRPNIGADMRFRAKHAIDWPEIYEETQRVLSLLKKA